MEKKLFSVCEIRPHLYISGYCTLSEQKLRQLGITSAVDATNIPKTLRIPDINYFNVPVDDSEASDLRKFFEPVAELTQKTKNSVKNKFFYK